MPLVFARADGFFSLSALNSVLVVEFILHKWHCCRMRQVFYNARQSACAKFRLHAGVVPANKSAHLSIPLLLNESDGQDEPGKRPTSLFTDCSIEVCSSPTSSVCLLRYMRRSYLLLVSSTERIREPS
jgi:hypothetical protein